MTLNVNGWVSDNQEISSSTIDEIEQQLGIKLPLSYVSLMKKWNGGHLRDEYQILIKGIVPENLNYYLGDGFWTLSTLAGISSDASNSDGLVCTAQTAHEWGIPDKVIAFDGDAHTWVAFDYRDSNSEEPKIIFIESDDLQSFNLADDFASFIDQLIPSTEVYDYDGNIIYQS